MVSRLGTLSGTDPLVPHMCTLLLSVEQRCQLSKLHLQVDVILEKRTKPRHVPEWLVLRGSHDDAQMVDVLIMTDTFPLSFRLVAPKSMTISLARYLRREKTASSRMDHHEER